MKPLVSIVTPSFNQARFLDETIRSVLSQDYPNIEYIIIDGDSTDGSKEIIQKNADRLAFWESVPDNGQTDAINKGFARATGEILAWLNSDDILLPGAVSSAVEELHVHPEVSMVYGNATLINAEGKKIGDFPVAQTDLKRLKRGYVHIPQQSSFFRADLWKKVGPLDPTFYFAMDYDLWVRLGGTPKASQRMTVAGRRCCGCITVMGGILFHLSSQSTTSENWWRRYYYGSDGTV